MIFSLCPYSSLIYIVSAQESVLHHNYKVFMYRRVYCRGDLIRLSAWRPVLRLTLQSLCRWNFILKHSQCRKHFWHFASVPPISIFAQHLLPNLCLVLTVPLPGAVNQLHTFNLFNHLSYIQSCVIHLIIYLTFNQQPIIFNSCSFLIQLSSSGSAALAVERRRFHPTINMSVSYRWIFSAVSHQISKEGQIYKILEVESYINYKLQIATKGVQLHLSRTH